MVTTEAIQADITTLHVDAIVNAANTRLVCGAGVCGAIHLAAGHLLAEECEYIGGCATGDAVVTSAYEMRSAKAIIHAVGPIYNEDVERSPQLLAAAYRAILQQCRNHHFHSVAIPCLSTGMYGYPKKEAAEIAVQTMREHLHEAPQLERVVFCCFEAEDFSIYNRLL